MKKGHNYVKITARVMELGIVKFEIYIRTGSKIYSRKIYFETFYK